MHGWDGCGRHGTRAAVSSNLQAVLCEKAREAYPSLTLKPKRVCSQAGDLSGAEALAHDMTAKAGLPPSGIVYNLLLKVRWFVESLLGV